MATKRRTQHDIQPPSRSARDGAAAGAAAPGEPAPAPKSAGAPGPEAPGPAAAPEAPVPEAAGVEAGAVDAAAGRRLAELGSQLEEANGRYLRLAADFDNFKKRARQERLDTLRFAAAALAERLLTVVDDAERALSHVPDGVDENWLKGVRLTLQQLQDVLASVGVQRIESVGVVFDPSLHEAIGSEESGEQPEDTVLAELRPGYRMHDRVLRPALVRVARRPG